MKSSKEKKDIKDILQASKNQSLHFDFFEYTKKSSDQEKDIIYVNPYHGYYNSYSLLQRTLIGLL